MHDEEIDTLKRVHNWEAEGSALLSAECSLSSTAAFYAHSETILELLDPKPHEIGLNLGCGAGRVEYQWSSKVKTLIGVDFSKTAIDTARRHCPSNAVFYQNDGRTLDFLKDSTVDFVMCETTFQHVPQDITLGYIREIYRVLKPGARCVLQIPRLDMYGDWPVCGGMTHEQVDAALGEFSDIWYPHHAPKQSHYIIPIATK